MNEQLIVKNFGPIKDATVDFKRVTVFIGPTGGGKSMLAKLAAVFRDENQYRADNDNDLPTKTAYKDYAVDNYFSKETFLNFSSKTALVEYSQGEHDINLIGPIADDIREPLTEVSNLIPRLQLLESELKSLREGKQKAFLAVEYNATVEKIKSLFSKSVDLFANSIAPSKSKYMPSERVFLAALEYSWAGLMRDDIGLSKILLNFANSFSLARKDVLELEIGFFDIKYLHLDGRDFIKIPGREEPLMLLEAASGIQSVTPMLVLLEHLSRNTEQAQSFIIEEPELNLYPTAQRDLVYWLLEKCTQGENDLTITTHSPYVLSALNLALYANKVAELFPHQHKKVAKIIPAKYWLKADEFSVYHVAGGGVQSVFDKKTGLLSESQLDEVSGHFADVFDRLTDLRIPEKKASAKAKSLKK